MSGLRHPLVWCPLALLIIAVAGAVLLARPAATDASHRRDIQVFWARHFWQVSFDSLSATCGCGLLTYSYEDAYSARGRRILDGLAVAGALIVVAAALAVLSRGGVWKPGAARLLLAGAALVSLCMLFALSGMRGPTGPPGTDEPATILDGALRAGAAMLGATFSSGAREAPRGALLAGLFSGAGLLWWGLACRKTWTAGVALVALRCLLAYVAYLVVMTTLVWTLEAPRGGAPAVPAGEAHAPLRDAPDAQRWSRSWRLVLAGACSGAPTERLTEGEVGDGAMALLAVVSLVGGVFPIPGGGVGFLCVYLALGACAASAGVRPRRGPADAPRRVAAQVAAGGLLIAVLLAGAVAVAMLVIEHRTASPFQARPTLADALLDACAALGGTGFHSGVVETITGENLTSGMRQSGGAAQANLYAYGMTLTMAAMFVGRLLPLALLAAFSGAVAGEREKGAAKKPA